VNTTIVKKLFDVEALGILLNSCLIYKGYNMTKESIGNDELATSCKPNVISAVKTNEDKKR